DAVGGVDVRRKMRADLPADCASQPACAQEVARALDVQQVLFVVMVDTGANGAAQVDATWVEAANPKPISRPGVSLTSTIDADAKAKFREAAYALLPDAPRRPKPKPQGAVTIHGDLVGGQPRHVTIPAMITAGVGVVGVGLVVGFGLEARSKFNPCNDDPNHCDQAMRETIHHWTLATDFSLAIAAGAAIATGILYATSAEAPHVVAT